MIEALSKDDFLHILAAAERIDSAVIGGQALNLWADALLSPDDYDALVPFTSKDIDLLGMEALERRPVRLSGRSGRPVPSRSHARRCRARAPRLGRR